MGEVLRFTNAVVPVAIKPPPIAVKIDDDFELLFIRSMVRRLRNSGYAKLSSQIANATMLTDLDGDRSELDALIDLGIGLVGAMPR